MFKTIKIAAVSAATLFCLMQTPAAVAIPYSMSCPQLVTYSFGTCTFRANPNEVVWVTSSNSAIAVGPYGSIPGNGQTGVSVQADGNGYGRITIRSFATKGQVTICAYDISRAYRTCSITRVN